MAGLKTSSARIPLLRSLSFESPPHDTSLIDPTPFVLFPPSKVSIDVGLPTCASCKPPRWSSKLSQVDTRLLGNLVGSGQTADSGHILRFLSAFGWRLVYGAELSPVGTTRLPHNGLSPLSLPNSNIEQYIWGGGGSRGIAFCFEGVAHGTAIISSCTCMASLRTRCALSVSGGTCTCTWAARDGALGVRYSCLSCAPQQPQHNTMTMLWYKHCWRSERLGLRACC